MDIRHHHHLDPHLAYIIVTLIVFFVLRHRFLVISRLLVDLVHTARYRVQSKSYPQRPGPEFETLNFGLKVVGRKSVVRSTLREDRPRSVSHRIGQGSDKKGRGAESWEVPPLGL